MMNKTEKKSYTPPSLEVAVIEMETGIAAGSASLVPGGTSPNTPDVKGWEEEDFSQDIEF
ncbi:hypothetical protein CMU89_02245 [Elizabethkingia anophelis]|uniref:hypothetical protein n=2 Tax=Elizabethkingia anophelis TaxID=1117645 RepID=UPI000389E896|nr:hypothetical protein [Elizabethkingia anophelis]AQW95898.1 hypothetical protein BBD30_17825 [Elizabethkingia anophelis]EQB93799.1 hypothetical protein C874_03445 [Elizabethkingia anophelis 502]MCT3697868.1 hypothetical protein [Elizabethkingia anophelis]MCT4297040.1 hypothetical protein [Elizabethkingia anophelis]MCT4300588.1 hypothetical protein [Elizabethkingia anophelis]